jgi:2,3-bisphosphoglycerate-independent phosphoglycerate mutase
MAFSILTKQVNKSERLSPVNNISIQIKPMVLLSLDGYGVAPPSDGNAISRAKTPIMDEIYTTFPHGELIASGEPVGLPANEEGNSEVGHLTMGVGTAILQSLKRISAAIEDGSFNENQAFLNVKDHVLKYHSKLHIMGIVSVGSVHSSLDHFYALIDFCRKVEIKNVRFHLFTDGRDAAPNVGKSVIEDIEKKIINDPGFKIASVSGRYYAMDRDRRWERTKQAYEAIVAGAGKTAVSAYEAINNSYQAGKTDEFVDPTVILDKGVPVGTVEDNDAVIFFNFRVDRPRQLTMAFVLPNFEKLVKYHLDPEPDHGRKDKEIVQGSTFERSKWPKNIYFVTMTEYQKNLPVSAIAFPPIKAKTSLPKMLSENGLAQLHLTESEKERMVTIYFDGLHEGRFLGEDVIIIPSPKVSTYDRKPEMSLYKVVEEFKKQIALNKYNFIVMNFANPDMVAHSGNMKATITAIEHVDKAVGILIEEILKRDGTLVISADHGNAEELLTFPAAAFFFTTQKGDVNTDHSNNPVPILIISNQFKGKPIKLPRGTLSDIAPTILTLMGLPIPSEMTGTNLLKDQIQTKNDLETPREDGMPFI